MACSQCERLMACPQEYFISFTHPPNQTVLSTPNYLCTNSSDRHPAFSLCFGGRSGGGGFVTITPSCTSTYTVITDDMSSKHVRTEVLVDSQTISKYSLVGRTMDSAVATKPLFYH